MTSQSLFIFTKISGHEYLYHSTCFNCPSTITPIFQWVNKVRFYSSLWHCPWGQGWPSPKLQVHNLGSVAPKVTAVEEKRTRDFHRCAKGSGLEVADTTSIHISLTTTQFHGATQGQVSLQNVEDCVYVCSLVLSATCHFSFISKET